MGVQFKLSDETLAEPHRLTVDDLFAMAEAGILRPGERVELFDGVLLRMNAKNIRHENIRMRLAHWLSRNVDEGFLAGSELGSRFTETLYLGPDIIVLRADAALDDLTPETVPLIIEVSDTTRDYDTCAKRDRYAELGLPEYWVIDVMKRELIVHREPEAGAYKAVDMLDFETAVSPRFAPELSVRIADFER